MKPHVTFLHGFMGDATDWDVVRAGLADWETTALDLQPAADWRRGVAQLWDAMPAQTVLVGYSMGARLALACALEQPARCLGLVFISGQPGLDDAAREIRCQEDLRLADRLESTPRREFLAAWYAQAVFANTNPAVIHDEIERKSARDGHAWPALLRSYSVGVQPDYWPRLNSIDGPLLAIAGWHDAKYVDVALRIARCGNGQVRVVPAAGHLVHREQPDVVVQLIADFLNNLDCSNDDPRRPAETTETC